LHTYFIFFLFSDVVYAIK